ncbi:signal peptidase I [Hellea sp.]|nr:signal peptidase I [Hellea sp.]
MAKEKKKSGNQTIEILITIAWALGISIVLRTFLFQPFHIPSGSMLPGLMKGDYIITTKYSLGYGTYAAAPLPFPVKKGRLFEREPNRGDVIVFRPEGDNKNFIKRLVGLPGDQMQVQKGKLFINGKAVATELVGDQEYVNQNGDNAVAQAWRETFDNGNQHIVFDDQDNGQLDNTSIYTVPAGYYFMMGDNRDNSLDSRVSVRQGGAGFVPTENLMGKAEFVLLSVDNDFALFKPWTWANMRGDRFFKGIK